MDLQKYHIYRHIETGERIIRTTSYSLPEGVYDHIDLIQPTTMFAQFKAFESNLHWGTTAVVGVEVAGITTGPAGNQVDTSCNFVVSIFISS